MINLFERDMFKTTKVAFIAVALIVSLIPVSSYATGGYYGSSFSVELTANGQENLVLSTSTESFLLKLSTEGAKICEVVSPNSTGVAVNSEATVVPGESWYPAEGETITFTVKCWNSKGDKKTSTATVHLPVYTPEPAPEVTVDIKANDSDGPVTIESGDSYVYSWTSTGADICEITSPTNSGVSLTGTSSPVVLGDIEYPATSTPVTLTITCENSEKSATDSVVVKLADSTTPPVSDVTVDIKANGSDGPVTITNGDSYTYTWVSTGADICEITSPTNSGVALNGTSTPVVVGDIEYPTTSTPITLTITCENSEKSATDSVVVKLAEPTTPGKSSTIVATKIVCDEESDLPNWSGTTHNITQDTAFDYVAHNDDCKIVSDWNFQWAPSTEQDPGGDFIGEASAPWTTFSATTTITIPSDKKIWVREVLKSDYINFAGGPGNLPGSSNSAEMYCHTDVLNYDNYDFIAGLENGKTYHCVAWNVKEKVTTPDVTVDLKVNESDGPVTIESGDSYTYTWVSTGADICEITSPTNSGVSLTGTSTPVVVGDIEYPTATSSVTLTITCENSEKSATDSVEVKLKKDTGGPGPSISVNLVANPDTIKEGATSTLSWTSNGADSCSAPWTGSVSASSTQVVSPATTTVYSITCTGAAGTATDTATITVDPIVTAHLVADPASIIKGATSTLSWTSENATICEAEWTNSISTSGNQTVSPDSTTSYSIVCTGPKGVATSTATVTVTSEPTTPPTNPPSGGGGGGGRGSSRSSSSLPAPTVCYYLRDYLRIDFNNDPVEVIKLQAFLSTFEGHNLNVTGTFDQATLAAVNAFQMKYFADVLEPWGHTGPTGYVYYTTQKKVNEIYCQRMFPLNDLQNQEIIAFRAFLESLREHGIDTDVYFPVVGVGGGDDTKSPTTTPTTTPTIPVVGIDDDENDSNGQNLRNLASVIFAQPESLADAVKCGYQFILILVIIYILGIVLKDVLYEETPVNAKKRFLAKWITIISGLLIAIVIAYFLELWCIILPLLIALIVSAVWLLTYEKHSKGKNGTGGSKGSGPKNSSVIPPVINLPAEDSKKNNAPSKGFSGLSVDTSKNEAVK